MHLTAGVAGELLLLGALLPLCAHAYEADSYWDLLGLTPVCSAIKLLQSKGNHHWVIDFEPACQLKSRRLNAGSFLPFPTHAKVAP